MTLAATQTTEQTGSHDRYARTIENSRRVRWDIDRDVLRGRTFDLGKKFLPDGLSKADQLTFLNPEQKRFFSQVQGRTYANMFGLVERFINAKVLELSREHVLGDQVALEALVRFSDEELKHQELFRRLETLADSQLPAGYRFLPRPNEVASVVLGMSTWAVLALTLHIELFTQAHYRESIEPDEELSALWKDVFVYHWKEESQHAVLDELEWARADEKLSPAERDQAVDDLIELVVAVDGILQAQAIGDSEYFINNSGRAFDRAEQDRIHETFLEAYRWQYIVSGVQLPRFGNMLSSLVTPAQGERIASALAPLM